jgi:hypothetical protein
LDCVLLFGSFGFNFDQHYLIIMNKLSCSIRVDPLLFIGEKRMALGAAILLWLTGKTYCTTTLATLPHQSASEIIDGHADAGLIASITHFGNYTINQMKEYLRDRGIPVNL